MTIQRKAGRVISRRNFERLRAIADALRAILDDAGLSIDEKSLHIVKGKDGLRMIGLISSNPYLDRDGEFVSERALRADVDAEWDDKAYAGDNVVLFWHDGLPIADIVWADVQDGFVIEIAKERDTPYAKSMLDMIERLDLEWGVSLGFRHGREDKRAGVYHRIKRHESSILPRRFAANPFTYAEVKAMANLRSMFLKRNNPDALDLEKKLRGTAKDARKKLDQAGVARKQKKAAAPPTKPASTRKTRRPVLKMLDVEELADTLEGMIDELVEETPEDLHDRLVEVIDASAVEEEDILEEEAEVDELDEDEKEEDAEDESEDEDEDKALRRKQTELLEQLVDDLAVVGELESQVKALAPLNKLPRQIDKMERRLQQLEQRLKGGPRAASRAEESEVDPDDMELDEHVKETGVDDELSRLSQVYPGLMRG